MWERTAPPVRHAGATCRGSMRSVKNASGKQAREAWHRPRDARRGTVPGRRLAAAAAGQTARGCPSTIGRRRRRPLPSTPSRTRALAEAVLVRVHHGQQPRDLPAERAVVERPGRRHVDTGVAAAHHGAGGGVLSSSLFPGVLWTDREAVHPRAFGTRGTRRNMEARVVEERQERPLVIWDSSPMLETGHSRAYGTRDTTWNGKHASSNSVDGCRSFFARTTTTNPPPHRACERVRFQTPRPRWVGGRASFRHAPSLQDP